MITAVNGPVLLHSEYALLTDIILATPQTVFQDKPHFEFGIVPGDGMHIQASDLPQRNFGQDQQGSHPRPAPIAECLVAPVPHGHRHTPSFIGCPSDDGMVAPDVLDGAVNQVRHPTLVIGRDEHDALDRPSLQELP
jgi:hypothetical protein